MQVRSVVSATPTRRKVLSEVVLMWRFISAFTAPMPLK